MLFFASFGTIVIHSSVLTTLIRERHTTLVNESVLFWWNMAVSALFGLLLIAIGGFISRFYALPLLAPLMVAAAVQVVAAAPGIVPAALLTRALRFSDLAIVGTIANVVSGAVGIGLALNGFGAWALAVQLIVAPALGSALYWQRSGWRPGAYFNPRGALAQFRFAGWMIPSNMLDLLYSQGFSLIVGKLYGARDLGLYARASNLQQIPQNIVTQIIGRVSLPLFSQRDDDPEALARGLLSANRLVMIGFAPLMLGIAACPGIVIDALFGPQWLSVAPVLTILALSAIPFPVIMLNLQLLLAKGDAARFLRVEVTRKALAVMCIVIGSLSGLTGLAWSQLAAMLIGLVVVTRPTFNQLGCGLVRQVGDLASIVVAAAGMALAILLAERMMTLPALIELPLLGVVGLASYAASCWLLRVKAFGEALHLIRVLRSVPEAS